LKGVWNKFERDLRNSQGELENGFSKGVGADFKVGLEVNSWREIKKRS
jgi:hypothetical protein